MFHVEEDYYLVALFLLLSSTWLVLRKLLASQTSSKSKMFPLDPHQSKPPSESTSSTPLIRALSVDEETSDDLSSSEGTAEDQEEDQHQEEEAEEGSDPSVHAPSFPFLSVKNTAPKSSPSRFYPNAREVQRFESDLVDGKVFLALRVAGYEDPYYRSLFAGKKRTIEVQFQLRFKRTPSGVLYLGGELPRKMQLGLMTKGLCNVVIALVNKISAQGHASFGKIVPGNEAETELPHIAFPLWSGATKMAITKAGQGPPPELGGEILETAEAKKKRKKAGFNVAGDLEEGDVLTFSMHTMYIDLVRWKMTNLGAIKDRDLSIFWGTMPLTIGLYETSDPKVHRNRSKSYYLKVAIRNTWYQRTTEPAVIYNDGEGKRDAQGSEELKSEVEKRSESSESEESTEMSSDDDAQYLPQSTLTSRFYVPAVVTAYRKQRPVPCFVLSQLNYCANDSGEGGSETETGTVVTEKRTFVQSVQSFTNESMPKEIVEMTKRAMKRLTASSNLVQQLRGEINRELLLKEEAISLPTSFFASQPRLLQTQTRAKFGLGQAPWKSLDLVGEVIFEGPVLRALLETQWREEWMVVLKLHDCGNLCMMLFRCGSRKPVVLVYALPRVNVRTLDSLAQAPFTDRYPAVSVDTIRRNFIIGFRCKLAREEFTRIFVCNPAQPLPAPDSSLENAVNDYVDDDLSQWNAKRRTIVNAKQCYFGWRGSYRFESLRSESGKLVKQSSTGSLLSLGSINVPASPSYAKLQKLESLREVEAGESAVGSENAFQQSTHVVEAALALKKAHERGSGVLEAETALHDAASALKRINMVEFSLNGKPVEKLAFFLNIYNGLRIHSAYLLGQPSSMYGWSAFGTRMSYAVGCMLFSLNEIEHCILRRNLNPPKIILSVAANDTLFTKLFITTKKDPRVNFCLNYGTKSSSTFIPVFNDVSRVEETMKQGAERFLQDQMVVDVVKQKIKIPKICYWYGKDFIDDGPTAKKQKDYAHDVALAVYPLLTTAQKSKFNKIYSDATVRFRKFQWSAMREFA